MLTNGPRMALDRRGRSARDEDELQRILDKAERGERLDRDDVEALKRLRASAEDGESGPIDPRLYDPSRDDPRAEDRLSFDAAPSSPSGQAALRVAIEDCAGILGRREALAMDSAGACYGAALKAMGVVSARGVRDASALRDIFKAWRTRLAADSHRAGSGMLLRSASSGADARFLQNHPAAARIRHV